MKDLNESQKYVHPSQIKDIKGGARFQNSDTLFARITPCLQNGKICQVKGLNNSLGFGSTEFLVFRGKEEISNTDLVYYLSRYDVVRKFAEQNMIVYTLSTHSYLNPHFFKILLNPFLKFNGLFKMRF